MKPNSDYRTSLTLLSKIKNSDPDAWVRFVRLYGPLVYSWVRANGLQPADAADVVQEVFGVVQQKIDVFAPKPHSGAFRSWLWGIARLCTLDHFRNAKKQGHFGNVDLNSIAHQAEEPESVGGETPRAILISTAIRIVKSESESNTWDAFWRMAVNGQSATEIAADLGTNAKAVRQAKFRITQKLRMLLSDTVTDLGHSLALRQKK